MKTKTSRCREQSCQEEIVWLKTPKGKNMPVDVESLTPQDLIDLETGEEILYRHGEHKSHFDTCKNARPFRTQNKTKGDS